MRACGVCPFCGLLCSGISLDSLSGDSRTSIATDSNCERATRGWQLSQPNASWHLKPLRHGRVVAADMALKEASQQIAAARRTLFLGLGTDVAGMRQIVDYARTVGGVLDHLHSDALQTNLSLMQHAGWIATTLSEIRFRADVIVLVGDSLLERFPRLLSLLTDKTEPKSADVPKLFWFGTDDLRFRTQAMLLPHVQAISLKKSDWLPALTSLLLHTGSPQNGDFDSNVASWGSSESFIPLARSLPSAHYAAWIWSAADFLSEGDDLILDLLVRLVAKRNETSRAAVLPLAGSNGDTTAQQVCTWKTGFPLRQAIQQHLSDYQPHRFRALDVLKRQDCDAAIYVSAFEPIEPPEEFWGVSGVKVVVGHPALKCATRADYFFPSGIPGVDHESHLFRGDGVTIISVDRKRDSLAPPVAEWFGKLLNQDKDAAFSQSYPQV